MEEEKKYKRGTLGWLKEQARKYGFGDNIKDWQTWKRKINNQIKEEKKIIEFYKELEKKYGKEFAEWAVNNGKQIPNKYLVAGCRNEKEYRDKLAQILGYKDEKERRLDEEKLRRLGHLPMEDDEDCALYFGVIRGEALFEEFLLTIFEYVKRMKHGNKGFDFICKNPRKEFIDKYPQFGFVRDKEYKFDLKVRCLNQAQFYFPVKYNAIADYFILVGWNDRNSLEPLHIWIFYRNDNIRGRLFWRIDTFTITNKSLYLLQFQKHELKDEIDKLKDIIKELKRY